VHVGDDCGNGPSFPIGLFCAPRLSGKVLDQVLIDPVVGVERTQQRTR